MVSLFHLSDLHFGRCPHTTRSALRALSALETHLDSLDQAPLVVITGDLTDDGELEQIELARTALQRLHDRGCRLIAVPGNHDLGRDGCCADVKRLAWFQAAFCQPAAFSYPRAGSFGSLTVIELNSMQEETGVFDRFWADGELGEHQLEALDQLLRDHQPLRDRALTKVIVCLHHHPFFFPDSSLLELLGNWATHWLKDGKRLMQILAGRVDALLYGHEHRQWDFSLPIANYRLTTTYRIPVILCCGSSSGVANIAHGASSPSAWRLDETEQGFKVSSVPLG